MMQNACSLNRGTDSVKAFGSRMKLEWLHGNLAPHAHNLRDPAMRALGNVPSVSLSSSLL